MSDIILIGPPGSGKGTQASRIAAERGWLHLSTGDLFRRHLREKTKLGEQARSYMDRGVLVPDDLTVTMVREHLSSVPRERRVVFDGFPRNVAQAEALDGVERELRRSLAGAVLLEVPRTELIARIAARATCASCQAVYNLATNPPRVAGVCDRCGGPVTQRSDETPEVVERRLAVYEVETKPLVDRYRACGILRAVDGRGDLDAVSQRIADAFAA